MISSSVVRGALIGILAVVVIPLLAIAVYVFVAGKSVAAVILWILFGIAWCAYLAGSVASADRLWPLVTPSSMFSLGGSRGVLYKVAAICGYLQILFLFCAVFAKGT